MVGDKKYAGILNNRVIVLSDVYKEYPPTIAGDKITVVECDSSVELGMVYDSETGEFNEYIPPQPEPIPEPEYTPSNNEIYENQMIIMSALADIAEMQMGVE